MVRFLFLLLGLLAFHSSSPNTAIAAPEPQPLSPTMRQISPEMQPMSPAMRSVSPAIQPLKPQLKLISPSMRTISPQQKSLSPAMTGLSVTLGSLAGWDTHGLADMVVKNVSTEPSGEFSGKLAMDGVSFSHYPQVFGLKIGVDRKLVVVILYSNFHFSDFLPTGGESPLDDIIPHELVVLLTPPEFSGDKVNLPVRIGHIDLPVIGGSVRQLEIGASVYSRVSVKNEILQLLRLSGVSSGDLFLEGKIHPQMLCTGRIRPAQLRTKKKMAEVKVLGNRTSIPALSLEAARTFPDEDLINSLELTISLPAIHPTGWPQFLATRNSSLMMKGINGKIATGIKTELEVKVGSGVLSFPDTTISMGKEMTPALIRSEGGETAKIPMATLSSKALVLEINSGPAQASGQWLTASFPIPNVNIRNLRFAGRFVPGQGARNKFSLQGKFVVAGSNHEADFSAILTGGSSAVYAISIGKDSGITLAQMLGWGQSTALGNLIISNILTQKEDGIEYSEGTIRGQPIAGDLKVRVFNGTVQANRIAAIEFVKKDPFALTDLIGVLNKSPLDDLQLISPVFILASGESTIPNLPADLAKQLSFPPEMALHPGLNLTAKAHVTGQMQELLQLVNIKEPKLPVSGTLPIDILHSSAKGGGLAPLGRSVPGGRITAWQEITPNSGNAESTFIKEIDLQIPLGKITIPNQPPFLSIEKANLVVTGISGRIAAGISASLSIDVGKGGLLFTDTVLNYENQLLSLDSGDIRPPSDWLPLAQSLADASITSIRFNGKIDLRDRSRDVFLLKGQYRTRGSASPQAFSITLSGGSPASYSISLDSESPLSQLLGWNSGGLDRIIIKNIQTGTDYTSGTFSINNLDFKVAVFNQGPAKIAAFAYDKPFRLSDLHRSLKDTPLDNLELARTGFVFVPETVSPAELQIPASMSSNLNLPSTLSVQPGLNIIANFQPVGEIKQLLDGLTVGTNDLPPIEGTLSPGIFMPSSGSPTDFKAPDITESLDLRIGLPEVKPHGLPEYFSFSGSKLALQGDKGQIVAAVVTDLSIRLAENTLDFENAEVSLKGSELFLSGSLKKIPAWLNLHGIKATIDDLSLATGFGSGNKVSDIIDLNGTYTRQGSAKPESFVVSLSGGSTAQYSISINSDSTLGQLLGWDQPGLEDLIIRNIQAGTSNDITYTQGTFAVSSKKIKPFTVIVFKSDGQSGANAAFMYDGAITLPELAPQLASTPLNQLKLTNLGFILAPSGGSTAPTPLPEPLASHIGVTSLALKPGMNLNASSAVVKGSDLEQLLKSVGAKLSGLPLKGTLDPKVLADDSRQLAKDILASIDLDIILDSVKLPGVGQNVSVTNSELVFQGIEGGKGVNASVRTDVAVKAGATALSFKQAAVSLLKTSAGTTVSISGTSPTAWSRPLGVEWLDIADLTLKASFGATNSFTVSGMTRVGNVKNLVVTLDLEEKPGQEEDLELSLTGADIPFTDIPVLQNIPNAGKLKMRDLVISNEEIGGTLKTDLPFLNEAEAIAFASGNSWNLAVELEDLTFSKLLPLPTFAKPLLDTIDLKEIVILLSASGVNSQISALPVFTKKFLQRIYGSTQGMVQVQKGVNALFSLDPGQLSPELAQMLPGKGKLTLQGGIGGIFGGPLLLNIAADIPPISLPNSLKFLALPENVQTAFFISLDDASVAMGLEVIADIAAKISKQTVIFDTIIKFELDSDGGVAIDLQGGTLSPWKNAVGINGLTMDTGTRLELFIAASSEVTLTIVGKTHIGKKEVDLTGSASLLIAEEIIDKAAFEGKVSELGLEDLLALTNAVADATGGKPVTGSMPTAKLTNVDVAFASPGVDIPEMNLSGGGIRIAGDVWLLIKDKALGRGFAQISESGLIMNGSLADFTIGAVSFKNNLLDCKATIMPPSLPYFKINGDVVLFKQQESAGLTIAPAEMELHADLNLGKLLNFDFLAKAGTPDGGLSIQELEKYDMSLESHLKSDIPGWLRTDGKQPVNDLVGGIKKQMDNLLNDVKTAQEDVDSLKVQISKAENTARENSKNRVDAEKDAEANVNHLSGLIADTNKEIDDTKKHIHNKCDYTTKVLGVKVLDVKKNSKCVSDNIEYGSKLAALETKKESLLTAKQAADSALSDLQKGENVVDPATVDPTVLSLKAELVSATAALQTAEQMAQGIEKGDETINEALNTFAQTNTFVLKNSLIQGSLQKALAGTPVMMSLDIEVEGKESKLSLGLSFTDPAYTLNQLETLALFVFSQIIESSPNAPPGLVKLVHDAYQETSGTGS